MNKTEICTMIEERLKIKIGKPFLIKDEPYKYIIDAYDLDVKYSRQDEEKFTGRSLHTLGDLLSNPDIIIVEIPPIEVYGLLYAFLAGYRYITRDQNGTLYVYPVKPSKLSTSWSTGISIDVLPVISPPKIKLPFISWEDKEPTAIADLLVMCGKNLDEIRN